MRKPPIANCDPFLTSEVSFSSGSSTLIFVLGPENRQPKENPDYGKRQKTKPKLKQTIKLKLWKEKFQEKLGLPPKKRFV